MRLADVLAPAIGYYRNGHPLVERANATIATVAGRCSASTGRPRRRSTCQRQGAGNRHTVHQPSWPTPTRVLSEAESAAAIASRKSSARANPGRRASSPRRSTASAARRRSWTSAASAHRGVLTGDDMARWQATSRRRSPTTMAATPCKPGAWTQGPVMLQQLALLKGFELDGADPTSRNSSTSWSRLEARLRRPREVLWRS